MIQRFIKKTVLETLFRGKVVIIYGPRQSGKTTLVKDILRGFEGVKRVQYYSCDDAQVREALREEHYETLARNLGSYELVVLDEAQRVENIGLKLKLLVDNNPSMQIIATGSASFDLANKIAEPLTGRYYAFDLLPLSMFEIVGEPAGGIAFKTELERSLIYGNYPDIVSRSRDDAIALLGNLSSSYLYKDILELEHIRKSDALEKIVTLVAHQIGNEVNVHEIAQSVGLNVRTVETYIALLEKAYVLFRLRAYSTNARNEIRRNFKVYFYDLGIRNAIVHNFNAMNNRSDVGGLFENWCILERTKMLNVRGTQKPGQYFWRNYAQKEVDYIEVEGGMVHAYECKYGTGKNKKYDHIAKDIGANGVTIVTPNTVGEFLRK